MVETEVNRCQALEEREWGQAGEQIVTQSQLACLSEERSAKIEEASEGVRQGLRVKKRNLELISTQVQALKVDQLT